MLELVLVILTELLLEDVLVIETEELVLVTETELEVFVTD